MGAGAAAPLVHWVDLVFAVMVLEGVMLAVLGRRGRSPLAPGEVLGFLLPGALLLGALRVALGGAAPVWVLALLALALPAHLIDLRRRWLRARTAVPAT